MAAKKVGTVLKEARTAAGLTQTQLAAKIRGLSANDISRCERGLDNLTDAQLRQIAKICGVTQTSLVNAPKNTVKTTASSAKKPASSSAKKPASSTTSSTAKTTSVRLTATEKRLIAYYRKADAQKKKDAMSLLKGDDTVETLAGSLIENLVGALTSGKRDGTTRSMPLPDEEVSIEVFGEENEADGMDLDSPEADDHAEAAE